MKQTLLTAAACLLIFASCGNKNCKCDCSCESCKCAKTDSATGDATAALDYKVVEKPQVDISKLPVDKDGYITIFDGKTLDGWRCYGKDKAGSDWNVDDGAIHLKGSGNGEGGGVNGGDILFAHKFKNFELTFEYKVSKGAN